MALSGAGSPFFFFPIIQVYATSGDSTSRVFVPVESSNRTLTPREMGMLRGLKGKERERREKEFRASSRAKERHGR